MIMPFGVPRKTNQTAQPTSGCSGNEGVVGEDEGAELLGCHGANQFHFRLRLRSWEVRHWELPTPGSLNDAPALTTFSRVFCLSFHFGIEQPVNIKNIGTRRKKRNKRSQIIY